MVERRHRGPLGAAHVVPAAQQLGDPGLDADQEAGEQDQPGRDRLEDSAGQGQQEQDAPATASDRAGQRDGEGDAGMLTQLALGSRSEPLSPAGVMPTVFDALATTGGRPTASRTGKLSSDATPTVEVRMPAPSPAARTASCSSAGHRFVAEQRDVADQLDVCVHRGGGSLGVAGADRVGDRAVAGQRGSAVGRAGRATRSGSPGSGR